MAAIRQLGSPNRKAYLISRIRGRGEPDMVASSESDGAESGYWLALDGI